MKVLSLFNGISGGRVALERAGIKVSRYVSYEIDKYANQIAKYNYPDDEYCGDVTQADFTQYKDFDMVIGGSPCQDLSISKKDRQGLEGTKSSLFYIFVESLAVIKPKYFFFENVGSMRKADKDIITHLLGVEPILIDSALVSAQQRKRFYWTNIPSIEQPEDRGILMQDVLESDLAYQDKSHVLTASYNGAVFWNSIERSQRSMVAIPVTK